MLKICRGPGPVEPWVPLLRRRISLFWAGDQRWFSGEISAGRWFDYACSIQETQVHYDDGESRWHRLDKETYRWIDMTTSVQDKQVLRDYPTGTASHRTPVDPFGCCAGGPGATYPCDKCHKWFHHTCDAGLSIVGIRMCKGCHEVPGGSSIPRRSCTTATAIPLPADAPPPPLPPPPVPPPPKFLYRAFAALLPGSEVRMDSMAGFLPEPARPVCASPAPTRMVAPEVHVLHGWHKRSCWLSATTGLAEALAFAMFAHAKEGVTPFSPKRKQTEPAPARRLRNANPEPIVKIETTKIAPAGGRESVRTVRLDSEMAADAAGVCARRARSNAIEVREVIFDGFVHADAVAAVYAINLRRGWCARLPRFTKDWMEFVHPACFSNYLEMLYREYRSDGAQWVSAPGCPGRLLELPTELQDEMLRNGRALLRSYNQPLAFGDRVEAQFGVDNDELWFPATVDRVHPDGSLDVVYDDNKVERAKPTCRVRRLDGEWHVGLV